MKWLLISILAVTFIACNHNDIDDAKVSTIYMIMRVTVDIGGLIRVSQMDFHIFVKMVSPILTVKV